MSGLVSIMTSVQPVSPEKKSLARRIPKALKNAADRLVDSLKINSVSEQMRRGRPIINKRRTVYSELLAELSNAYFRMATASTDELLAVHEEFLTLIRAGMPLDRGLAEFARDVPGRMRPLVQELTDLLAQGHDAAPRYFAD